ncbi:MAG: DUF3501 family protein [Gammaproteobacteria bacterium]|nr:DUF3501 domain-containing protein [Gammaproteobacteria bacterium]
MEALKVSDLYSLEQYHKVRKDFRAKVLEHKKRRKLPLGPNATFHFEDRLTMQYQVQEMLRIERIFEEEAIKDELDAYNPLIPDGSNFKATFMLEFPDVEERRRQLARLIGIEDHLYLEVEGAGRVVGIADEDLERSAEDKTSSVHFVRFELTPEMKQAVKDGATFKFGCTHPEYVHESVVPPDVAEALRKDLD